MKFLEYDLEQIIMKTDNSDLQNRGLNIFGQKRNQVRVGHYGILDVITFEKTPWKEVVVNIYELKKNEITVDSFFQAVRYAKGCMRYLELNYKNIASQAVYRINVIGRSIDLGSSLAFLPDLYFEQGFGVSFYTYEYEFDGISFNQISDYRLTFEGFKPKCNG